MQTDDGATDDDGAAKLKIDENYLDIYCNFNKN